MSIIASESKDSPAPPSPLPPLFAFIPPYTPPSFPCFRHFMVSCGGAFGKRIFDNFLPFRISLRVSTRIRALSLTMASGNFTIFTLVHHIVSISFLSQQIVPSMFYQLRTIYTPMPFCEPFISKKLPTIMCRVSVRLYDFAYSWDYHSEESHFSHSAGVQQVAPAFQHLEVHDDESKLVYFAD